ASLCGHIVKDGVLPLPVEEVESGDSISLAAGRLLQHAENALRLGVRKRLQKHGVHEAEDRGVRANPDRQSGYGDDREYGALEKGAESVTDVLRELIHGHEDWTLKPAKCSFAICGKRRLRGRVTPPSPEPAQPGGAFAVSTAP